MIVNAASLAGLFVNLKTTFNRAFTTTETIWEKIAMRVPSTGAYNDYKWLKNFPRMRQWIGAKHIKSLEGDNYVIRNDDWEVTVEVDRNDIEDDQLGIYAPQAHSAGDSAKQLPDEIVGDLANGVFTLKCFDGQFMCDTDHPVGDGLVSNKGVAALSVATLAAAQASYGAARTAMRKFKDEEGRPLNVRPKILMVCPALEDTANALINTDRLEDGKPNPYKGTAEVLVNDYLTSDTAWFLLDTSKSVKPFIYQERKAPVFVSLVDMNSDNVFLNKKYLFGAEARAAGGYGFWQLIWGSTGTG
jgi:phage major head subunit gpT-like protein